MEPHSHCVYTAPVPRPVRRPRDRAPLQLLRHYDPEAGRYVTPDPLGLAPAANPAGYVHAPSTTADPMGLAPCMDTMLDLATKLNNVLPEGQARQKQVVAIIHAETPEGPTTFVSGTSMSKLTPAQVKLAKSMGLVPLPKGQHDTHQGRQTTWNTRPLPPNCSPRTNCRTSARPWDATTAFWFATAPAGW
ncbi:RHS repeat-associated core domain-containing protein [Streptomyces sp. NPDC005752]|uniref:RHS repeat-associated core domain-containing protein n=1 Tax=Streptomyces sp. NPDC005752 TaxID=3157065 RepID=UPI0033FC0443